MNVIMPQLGETVLEGTIAKWYKKPGDPVKTDESLFDVETEKVSTEIPAPANGVLEQILVPEGATVAVGVTVAVIRVAGTAPRPATELVAAAPALPAGSFARQQEGAGAALAPRPEPARLRLSPVVRRLLGESGLQPADVPGTGEAGRITRQDVLALLAKRKETGAATSARTPAAPSASALHPGGTALSAGPDDYVVALNKTRRLTAAHMVRSKAVSPHTLQAVEVDFHAVDQARRKFGAAWKQREGFSLTYLPFIARAVCLALPKFPYVNASFCADELIVHRRIHLGVAVDLNLEGLMVAVLRDAHHQNLRGLALGMHALANKARSATLSADEATGGTYTISNSGSFGTLISAPVIYQPQSAILSMDGVRKKPVVLERADGDVIAIRPVGVLAQSFDHRAFDGAYSASFLRELRLCLEDRDWSSELA